MANFNEQTKELVGNKLIEMVEKTGVCFWRKPWAFEGIDRNFKTEKEYQGVNTVVLNMERLANQYSSKCWLTFNQISDLQKTGKKVYLKKGSVSAPITWWSVSEKQKLDEKGQPMVKDDGTPMMTKYFLLKRYNVFNASCVDGLDTTGKEPAEPAYDAEAIKTCEEMEEELLERYTDHPFVTHGGDSACYIPSMDTVCIPESKMFLNDKKVDHYLSTLAHELAHSTGNEKRLNRKIRNCFGNDSYSYEELVAESTASMICAYYHKDAGLENSVAYLKSWLGHLKKNPSALYDAIAEAKKAFDYIIGTDEESEN